MNKQNKTSEFVGFYYMKNQFLCDGLIDYFEKSNDKYSGVTSTPNKSNDKSIKDSTDLTIYQINEQIITDYCNELMQALKLYINDFSFSL